MFFAAQTEHVTKLLNTFHFTQNEVERNPIRGILDKGEFVERVPASAVESQNYFPLPSWRLTQPQEVDITTQQSQLPPTQPHTSSRRSESKRQVARLFVAVMGKKRRIVRAEIHLRTSPTSPPSLKRTGHIACWGQAGWVSSFAGGHWSTINWVTQANPQQNDSCYTYIITHRPWHIQRTPTHTQTRTEKKGITRHLL